MIVVRTKQRYVAALAVIVGCSSSPQSPSFDLDEDPRDLEDYMGKYDGDVCSPYPGGPLSGDDLLVLVNKDDGQQLRQDWSPPDLVGVPPALMMPGRSGLLDQVALDAFVEMADAARTEQAIELVIRSGYRSFQTQCFTFDFKVEEHGLEHAKRFSAEPGRSQHQLGTTIDITAASLGFAINQGMGNAPEGHWLANNAHRFGFALSYPRDAEDETGYGYEPWHFRYIGRDAAIEMFDSGDMLEIYLRRCQDGDSALQCPREEHESVAPNTGFIGGACATDSDCASIGSDAFCLDDDDGYSGGYCTLGCEGACPDRAGRTSITTCALTGLGGLCHSRCDSQNFPGSGCRTGYVCTPTERPQGDLRDVCLPQ